MYTPILCQYLMSVCVCGHVHTGILISTQITYFTYIDMMTGK